MTDKEPQQQIRPSSEKRKHPVRNLSYFAIPVVVAVVVAVLGAGVIASVWSQPSQSASAPGDVSVPVVTAYPQASRSLPYPDVPRITLQETMDKLEQGQAVLLDVRSKLSYDKSHAAGALWLPEDEIGAYLQELPRDKELVLYCT